MCRSSTGVYLKYMQENINYNYVTLTAACREMRQHYHTLVSGRWVNTARNPATAAPLVLYYSRILHIQESRKPLPLWGRSQTDYQVSSFLSSSEENTLRPYRHRNEIGREFRLDYRLQSYRFVHDSTYRRNGFDLQFVSRPTSAVR